MINHERILVVLAHPDDEVLGCGGLIKLSINQRKKVRVVILGEGSSCRWSFEKLNSEEVRKTITQRKTFAKNSFNILGVDDYIFYDLPCGRFDTIPLIDITKKIENEINLFKPDTIITHFKDDTNSDHRVTFNAMNIASRPIPNSTIKNILCCEILSSTEWRFSETFQPNIFVDISNTIQDKINAFECYYETEGQPFPFPRCEKSIKVLANYRGIQSSLNYAEAFILVRSVN